MNPWVRNIGYGLVFIGLAVEVVWMARLGYRRAEVERQLRNAAADTEKAIAAHSTANLDFLEARQRLITEKLGWGYEWTLPPGGAAGAVQQIPGRRPGSLAVAGLGRANGLTERQVNDASGARMVPPTVHVFTEDQNNKVTYIGEFTAGIGPNELTPQSCILDPTWNAGGEAAAWNFSGKVRFRSQIPAGDRSMVDNLIQSIFRAQAEIDQALVRMEDQKELNLAADAALAGRRSELLGNPDAEENADHPEYKVGLVRAIESLEEERNAVQAGVDELRRLIRTAIETRSQLLQSVQQIAASLGSSGTRVSRLSE